MLKLNLLYKYKKDCKLTSFFDAAKKIYSLL